MYRHSVQVFPGGIEAEELVFTDYFLLYCADTAHMGSLFIVFQYILLDLDLVL